MWDGSHQYIYIDGILDSSADIGDVTVADDPKPLEFGNHYGSHPFAGSIDEIQISKVVRNADWILSSYLNQQNPFSFMSFGFEESFP